MEKETKGTVISVSKQWWLKVNTKALRMGPLDGAVFPHIVKVSYTVDGREYTKRKWVPAGERPPEKGGAVRVLYDEHDPARARIEC